MKTQQQNTSQHNKAQQHTTKRNRTTQNTPTRQQNTAKNITHVIKHNKTKQQQNKT